MAMMTLPNAVAIIAPKVAHNILRPSYIRTVTANVGQLMLKPEIFRAQAEAVYEAPYGISLGKLVGLEGLEPPTS
jgi:hypothetical protein